MRLILLTRNKKLFINDNIMNNNPINKWSQRIRIGIFAFAVLVGVIGIIQVFVLRQDIPETVYPSEPVFFNLSGAHRVRMWNQWGSTNDPFRLYASDETQEGAEAVALFQYLLTGNGQFFIPYQDSDNPALGYEDYFAFSLTFYSDETDESEMLKVYVYLAFQDLQLIRYNDVFYTPSHDLRQPSPDYPDAEPWVIAENLVGVENWELVGREFPLDS